MKLNLIDDNDKSINGYENINVIDNIEDIEEIFQSSCDEVIVNNCLSCLSHSEAQGLLVKALSKVSIGGQAIIKFLDIGLIGEALYHSNITAEQFNDEILTKAKSVNSIDEIISILKQSGFETEVDLKSCWCGYIIHTTRI